MGTAWPDGVCTVTRYGAAAGHSALTHQRHRYRPVGVLECRLWALRVGERAISNRPQHVEPPGMSGGFGSLALLGVYLICLEQ